MSNKYNEHIIGKNMTFSEDTRVTQLNNNVLVLGGSGSGKTGSYIVPNLQNINNSFVCSDTKGQLHRMFASKLIERGYLVYKLDFVNMKKSNGYNPLRYVQRYKDGTYCENDVKTIAYNLWSNTSNIDPIWDLCCRDYLMFIISYCIETEPADKQNLCRVAELHAKFNTSNGKAEFLNYLEEHSGDKTTFAVKQYSNLSTVFGADKMYSSIMGFVNVVLSPFLSKESQNVFGGKASKEFNIYTLGLKKTALFINVSDTDASMDRVVNMFYGQAMQILCKSASYNPDGRLKIPVRFFLDDFAASARIDNFGKLISVIRSRDIYVSIILQDKNQLVSMYSEAEGNTIINNCDHILYYGGQDIATVKYVSDRTCKTMDTIMKKPAKNIWVMTNGEASVCIEKIPPYSTLSQKQDIDEKNMEEKNIPSREDEMHFA